MITLTANDLDKLLELRGPKGVTNIVRLTSDSETESNKRCVRVVEQDSHGQYILDPDEYGLFFNNDKSLTFSDDYLVRQSDFCLGCIAVRKDKAALFFSRLSKLVQGGKL